MEDRGPARRRRASRLHPVRLLSLTLFCLLLSGTGGAAAYFLPVVVAGVGQTGQTVVVPPSNSPGVKASPIGSTAPGAPFTVLLLGSDDDGKNKSPLTQSMILVRVEPATKHVTMLSIPRDLWVPLSTGGSAKLNAADLPDIVDALKGNFKTSMGLDRVRSLLGVATAFDLANIKQVVLYVPLYTSYGQISGQSVILPHWSQILAVTKANFP